MKDNQILKNNFIKEIGMNEEYSGFNKTQVYQK